jgi:hypothetical protein
MGLFHAAKKRMIVSWSVSLGVATIVAAVKRLPYPWRNIVDAGVVFGLTWGTISILGGYIISLITGIAPIAIVLLIRASSVLTHFFLEWKNDHM